MQGDSIEFDAYKDYVFKHLREGSTSWYAVEEEIEQMCWEICKPFYRLDDTSATEERAYQVIYTFHKMNIDEK